MIPLIIIFLLFVLLLFTSRKVYEWYYYQPFRKSVVICGAVYNTEPYLDKVFHNIQQIAQEFEQCTVVIAIDIGTDQSLQKLKEYQHRLKTKGISVRILEGQRISARRTENLAIARNRIIQALRELYSVQPFEYFIMMDCDDVCSRPIQIKVLKEVFQRSEEWDAVTFIGSHEPNTKYYDYWALSIRPYLISCWHFSDPAVVISQQKKQIHNLIQKKKWIPCYSAFNGFAIYKPTFLNYDYEWRIEAVDQLIPETLKQENLDVARSVGVAYLPHVLDGADCEHRYFHFQATIRDKAKMFIVPDELFAAD